MATVPIVIIATVVGCSEAKAPSAGPALGAPEVPWDGKTLEEKRAFMASRVEPEMRHLFQKRNGKAYAGFGCETCHGGDMEVVDFHMPNSLYALPEKDTIAGATEYDEDTTKFMVSEVVPTFAKLLGKSAGEAGGVACFTCHPKE